MKFLKKVFLILALPVLVPNSYAMENGQNGKENKIIIQCEDDQQFIIAYDNEDEKNDLVQALNQSETFKHMMEDIPLKDGSTLIIPVTKKRFEDHIWPYICEIDKNTANKNIEAKNLNLKTMCDLIKDANYLDIEPLLDICCDILAKKLCSDEGLETFKKTQYYNFPTEINKKIAKIMFKKYVKDDVKAIINKKLAKKKLDHNHYVEEVYFSQDGKLALTVSWYGTEKIWNLNWHKDLTCEQIQLLLLHYNKQPINFKHLNTIAATLPENLQEIIKHQSNGLKKYLIAGAAITGIAGLYLLWNYLQK